MRDVDQHVWRASLESTISGERQSFSSVEDMCDYLKRQTGAFAVDQRGEVR
jgi:hypothetical protein